MKITFLSDTHSLHNEITVEPCDIFCYTGDATNRGSLQDWVSFFEWLRQIPAKHIVWIGGNHDLTLDKLWVNDTQDSIVKLFRQQAHNDVKRLITDLPKHIHYVQDKAITIEGIHFYGSPYSPSFSVGWAFNQRRGKASAANWAKIPKNTNILLTHTPPNRELDNPYRKKRYTTESSRVGCRDLWKRIKELPNLQVHSFGHIHENTGMQYLPVSNTRRVLFVNACIITNRGKFVTKQPITINYVGLTTT